MAKHGPKNKIGPAEEKQICAILEAGSSLSSAAKLIGVDNKTVWNHRQASPEFSMRVNMSVEFGKKRLIDRIVQDETWQSAAWMLERKWGKEYGKKETIKQEITEKTTGRVITIRPYVLPTPKTNDSPAPGTDPKP